MEEATGCLICHEDLLDKESSALSCGHVYHTECFQQWHNTGKAICPACKQPARADQLRVCHFEMAVVTAERAEEMRALRLVSAEDLSFQKTDLDTDTSRLKAALREVSDELAVADTSSRDTKRTRLELEEQARESAAAIATHKEDKSVQLVKCTDVQNFIDTDQERYRWKLPVPQAQGGDADVEVERRRLRTVRTVERVKQLHEALLYTRRQETECSARLREKEESVKGLESALVKLRQEESKMNKELQARKEAQAEARQPGPDSTRKKPEDFFASGSIIEDVTTTSIGSNRHFDRASSSSRSFDRASTVSGTVEDEFPITRSSSSGGARLGALFGRDRVGGGAAASSVGAAQDRRPRAGEVGDPDLPGASRVAPVAPVARRMNPPSTPSVASGVGGGAGGGKFGALFGAKRPAATPAGAGNPLKGATASPSLPSRDSLRMRLSERGA